MVVWSGYQSFQGYYTSPGASRANAGPLEMPFIPSKGAVRTVTDEYGVALQQQRTPARVQ